MKNIVALVVALSVGALSVLSSGVLGVVCYRQSETTRQLRTDLDNEREAHRVALASVKAETSEAIATANRNTLAEVAKVVDAIKAAYESGFMSAAETVRAVVEKLNEHERKLARIK